MNAPRPLTVLGGPAFLALLLSGCSTAPSAPRADSVPMYGQPSVQRSELLRRADEDFIKDASATYGDRERASRVWAAQAEESLKLRRLDLAMQRYNQAWLLNPKNYQPYWGFGRVLVEQGKYEEALTHLERAKRLIDDRYQKVALLSDTGNVYAILAAKQSDGAAKRAQYFALADRHYAQSTSLDPKYASAWAWWAWNSYNEGKYADAWRQVKRARQLGWDKFSDSFLRDLTARMPEP